MWIFTVCNQGFEKYILPIILRVVNNCNELSTKWVFHTRCIDFRFTWWLGGAYIVTANGSWDITY